MATNDLTNKYFIKNTLTGTYADFATLFDGLRILRIDGFLAQGQSKNVYTASWEYEDEEDFAIVMQDDSDAPRIIHESADINITFIIRQKYATGAIDVHTQHKKFIEYMTEKDVWIKNGYNNNLVAHCVCLKEYSPTTEKYQRGSDSWVMGTITLHKLTSKLYHEFALTASLIGCTSDLPPVVTNEKLFATIIPLSGHQQLPWNTKVTMGGFDITSSVYDKATGAVSIPSVTGDISIEAEAVMMSSEYEPVEYVASIVRNSNNYYPLGFQPTHLTELELDFLSYQRSQSLIVCPSNMAASANVNNYSKLIYWSPWSASGSIYGKFLFGNGRNASLRHTPPAPNVRFKVYIGKGKIAYDGWEYDTEDDSEWSTSTAHYMFGRAGVSASVCFDGEIYGVKHRENEVLAHRYIPCRRLSDGHVGLYDVVNGNVLSILSPTYQIAPHIITTRNYTGCIAERLSESITGTAARAVIGSTWQIKISPTSGYTFTGGTTPQVLIDGVDVTSQVVSDNGDGTYNVTIANVEDKPIEITAVAVSDGTANATNSVTPMGGNTENNEEEM